MCVCMFIHRHINIYARFLILCSENVNLRLEAMLSDEVDVMFSVKI